MTSENIYNEVEELFGRNENLTRPRKESDVVEDMRKILVMSRECALREKLVQAQGVRRTTKMMQATAYDSIRQICASILGNLAHSVRARMSGSSCDRWGCVSHRHNCPLYTLLIYSQQGPAILRRVSAAAVLSFSVQNECQLHLDNISGINVLLSLLKCNDGDVKTYVAATLWNITKSPLLELKLESVHRIMKDVLIRELTNILLIPVEPLGLTIKPMQERGTTGTIESDGDNYTLMLTASITSQYSVVLQVQNYTGPQRQMNDSYSNVKGKGRKQRGTDMQVESKSIAHFDERGALASRSCGMCSKRIRVSLKSKPTKFLLCKKVGCGQIYHTKCSRWSALARHQLDPEVFYCNACVLQHPLCYQDFIAMDIQHAALLSEQLFSSVHLHACNDDIATTQTSEGAGKTSSSTDFDCILIDESHQVVGAGRRRFQISDSSSDEEMAIVWIVCILRASYPANVQQPKPSSLKAIATAENDNNPTCSWQPSYAREAAGQVPVDIGRSKFWPTRLIQSIVTDIYPSQSISALESAWIYEFHALPPRHLLFSFGAPNKSPVQPSQSDRPTNPILWTTLYSRRAICAKFLAERIGLARAGERKLLASIK